MLVVRHLEDGINIKDLTSLGPFIARPVDSEHTEDTKSKVELFCGLKTGEPISSTVVLRVGYVLEGKSSWLFLILHGIVEVGHL